MGLRADAEKDLAFILEDDIRGGAFPVIVTDPAGFISVSPLKGYTNDISQLIDPDTGQAVSGRLATVSLRISSLIAAGYTTLPENVSDATGKPWLIAFDDINGNSYTFKVSESNPDRAIGIVTCSLETYNIIIPPVVGDLVEWTPGDILEWTTGDSMEWVN